MRLGSYILLPLYYGIGLFIISIQIFLYLFILKQRFNAIIFGTIYAAEILVMAYFYFKHKLHKLFWPKREKSVFDVKSALIFFLLTVQLLMVVFFIITRPTMAYDSIAVWSYKAKVLYYTEMVSFDKESVDYLGGGGHLNYPWQIPLSQFWMSKVLGQYDDNYSNFIYGAYYMFSLLFVYGILKRFLSDFYGLALTFILSSIPLFFYHAFTAYADLPLAFYFVCAFGLLVLSLRDEQASLLYLSAVFISICIWIKIEGLIMVTVFSIAVPVYNIIDKKLRRRDLLAFFLPILFFSLPWFYFIALNRLGLSNTEPGFVFHPEVIKSFYEALFVASSWNIWWFIFILIIIMSFKNLLRSRQMILYFSIPLLVLLVYLGIYIFTNNYVYAIDQTALSRNILSILPSTILLAGLAVSHMFNHYKRHLDG